jgi:hypothetical protein
VLVLRFEADDQSNLDDIRHIVEDYLKEQIEKQ